MIPRNFTLLPVAFAVTIWGTVNFCGVQQIYGQSATQAYTYSDSDYTNDTLSDRVLEASFSRYTAPPACETCTQNYSCDPCACPGCVDDFWTRQYLCGDMNGMRSGLAESGIILDLDLTQFYQGVTSGGTNQTFRYGGKMDYFLTFLGEPLGLNKGFTATLHAETRFGDDVILDAAGLAPVNANMLYPALYNTTAITGLQFLQALSEEWVVTFGKINTVDLFYTMYPQTGRGVDGFMNASSFLPLTVSRTVPLSFLGAGVLNMRGKDIQGGLLVYDSNNSTTTSGFEDLFDNGANIAALWRLFTEFGGRPGSHLFLGTWASGQSSSLDPTDWVFDPGVGLTSSQQTGSWSFLYVLEQQLWADPCNPKRNIGLLSQWGLADPETTPYSWIGNVALQGQGLLARRDQDTMGVAYFYSGLSNDFKNLFSPLLQLDDLQGVELYYNAAITPWFHLTADLQFVEPGLAARDTATVFGIRGKIDF